MSITSCLECCQEELREAGWIRQTSHLYLCLAKTIWYLVQNESIHSGLDIFLTCPFQTVFEVIVISCLASLWLYRNLQMIWGLTRGKSNMETSISFSWTSTDCQVCQSSASEGSALAHVIAIIKKHSLSWEVFLQYY